MDVLLQPPPGSGRRVGLEQALRDAIQSGRLAAGASLPATRVLAQELGVSRGTVVAAYDQLAAEGYLLTRHGVGTWVADLSLDAPDAGRAPTPARLPLSLAVGVPDLDRFPTNAWLRSMRRGLAATTDDVYDYGDSRGWRPLRSALATYLGRVRGVRCAPEQVVVTSGSVQSMYVLGRMLVAAHSASGPVPAAAENPGWALQIKTLRRAGVDVRPMPVDELGARTTSLIDERAVLVTPTHQFPTGVVLGPERRRALVGWARVTGGLVIEDDYDGEFRYDRQPVGALQGAAPDHVVYLGSASKTLSPALRIGWMVVPPRLVDAVVDTRRYLDLHTDTLNQVAMTDFLTTHGYDRHIHARRRSYRRRRTALLDLLRGSRARLPVRGIAAGLHVLAWLPAAANEDEVTDAAAAEGLELNGVNQYCRPFEELPPGLVIGYARPSEHTFTAALRVLERVLRHTLGTR